MFHVVAPRIHQLRSACRLRQCSSSGGRTVARFSSSAVSESRVDLSPSHPRSAAYSGPSRVLLASRVDDFRQEGRYRPRLVIMTDR